MDEQRQKAYLNLIQALLTCPKWEESNILESYAELVDFDLIEMMKNIANQLQVNGREIEGNWLSLTSDLLLNQKIAKDAGFNAFVSKSDNALSSIPAPDYFDINDHDFLMEVLQRVEHNPNIQYLCPLLEKNLSRLNYRYLGHLLEIWADNKFSEVTQQDAQDIALVIWNFGVLINQFEKGNKESNQELAIIAYNTALKVFTHDNYPKNYADLQYNLGNLYAKRIKDNKADNLEKALVYYQQALKVYNVSDFPNEWAFTQINIANIYQERFKDDQADNIEKAIECLKNALQIFNQNNHPYNWGIIQLNLSAIYQNRIKGNFSINLDYALVCCQNALQVFTIESYPYEWAEAQSNLGSIYQNKINKSQSKNLEEALTAYNNALQVFSYENFPYQWANSQFNLALVYLDRKKGDKLDNLNQALNCCYQALRIYTPKNLVYDWADVQETLGDIYAQLTDDLESVERAIVAYQYALSIFTLQKLPRKYYQTITKLGHIYYSVSHWTSATEVYSLAIEALENIRLKALNPQRRQEIFSDAITIYRRIVQSYLNLNQTEKALQYIERSKTRNLVELLANRDLIPKGDIPSTVINELNNLRDAIRNEEIHLAIVERNRNNIQINIEQPILLNYDNLNQFKQRLKQLIETEINPIDSAFNLTQQVTNICFNEIQDLIDEQTVILQWYVTDDYIHTFIITRHYNQPIVKSFSSEDRNQLIKQINTYINFYYSDRYNWYKELPKFLQHFSQLLHLDEIITEIPNSEYTKLILIPYLFLHLLPLHALPLGNHKCLLDLFTDGVKYVPSCQLLKVVKQQAKHEKIDSLFAIANPNNDQKPLIYAELEVETIRNFFSNVEILSNENATEEAVKGHEQLTLANCLHFSCHGKFNPDSPLESYLSLSKYKDNKEDGKLTLAEIFDLNLSQCGLVILSACETGLTDFQSLSDEYIGLPNGFLFAGSPSVVSSLWEVDDLSTAFLIIKFYHNYKQENLPVTQALNEAQKWLRNITKAELKEWIKTLPLDSTLKKHILRLDYIQNLENNEQPFNNPYYWAAFCVIGK